MLPSAHRHDRLLPSSLILDGRDRIGRIIDPLSGQVLQNVESPVDGILFTIREYPIVDEGSLIGRLLKKEVMAI